MQRKMKTFLVILTILLPAFSLAAGGKAETGSSPGGKPLTYWIELGSKTRARFTNLGDTFFAKELMKRTGVTVTFLHPPAGGAGEHLNLIIASGELPDIIERSWLSYSGGPEKAIADEVIIKLNDVLGQSAPNLSAYLRNHPDMDKMIKTDNGTYYAFPFIRGDRSLLKSSGFMVRKDWLDDLNMKPPVTVDDWHAMLTAFKTKKGASVPLALATYFLTGTDFSLMDTYGIARGFFLDDSGKVRYGLIEPGYRSFLTVMNQWYKEGLLDPDFASTGDAQMAAKITSGAAGATMATAGGGMGSYIPSGRATDPHYSLIGVPSPVLRAGEKPSITAFNWYYPGINSAAISTKCGDIAAAVKLLDFGYSQEGSRLYNFGIEGESFTMVNGKPAYTDLIMKNPNGWEFNNIQAAYCQAGSGGPFVQDPGVLVFVYPEQAEAVNVWAPTDVMFTRKIPPVSPTPDESAEFARIMGEINTYTQEMMVKFILGTENLAGFDAYVNSVRRMGIDRAIEIQNTAVGRYKAR